MTDSDANDPTPATGPATSWDDFVALLFGNVAMDAWPPPTTAAGEPDGLWATFDAARRHLAAGDQDLAIRAWGGLTMAGLPTRHRLQAWTFLRSVNVHPDASIAGQVLGVVAQVWVETGHDVLAAYEDGTLRYVNFSGAATIVDEPMEVLAQPVANLLAGGQQVADAIGPWEEPLLPPLPAGASRFTMLTPGGLRFGQGEDSVLRQDPMAAPLWAAATDLLVAVVGLTGS